MLFKSATLTSFSFRPAQSIHQFQSPRAQGCGVVTGPYEGEVQESHFNARRFFHGGAGYQLGPGPGALMSTEQTPEPVSCG